MVSVIVPTSTVVDSFDVVTVTIDEHTAPFPASLSLITIIGFFFSQNKRIDHDLAYYAINSGFKDRLLKTKD